MFDNREWASGERLPYPVLRTFSLLLRIIGWVLVAFAVICFFMAIMDMSQAIQSSQNQTLIFFVYALKSVFGVYFIGGSLLFGFSFVMAGEVITVFIDIAFNTAQLIANTRPLWESRGTHASYGKAWTEPEPKPRR
jgi:hypothetical protein